MKEVVEFDRYGDVTLYALKEDPEDSIVSALVGDLLVPIAFPDQLRRQPDVIPHSSEALLERLREGTLVSDRLAHRLVWEALGLPVEEWERRKEEARLKREQRQDERQASYDRQQREEAERIKRELEETAASVLAGESVSGKKLYALARHMEIKVHPRTAGSLKDGNVSEVDANHGTGTTRAIIGSAFKLYRDVQEKLKA